MEALIFWAVALAMSSPAPPTSPPARAVPSPEMSQPVAPEAAGPDQPSAEVKAGASAAGEPSASAEILAGLEGPLADYVREVLERNPDLARARAQAAAAAVKAPQVSALSDPMAALTLYLAPPETRVGPQRVMAALSERFPWFGKLRAREQAALAEAAAARARVEALSLGLLTEARRLAYELAFLDAQERVLREDRETLAQYEEIARARYASGVGLGQAVVKIQAEITRTDSRLLELETRRAALVAAANALRDRPGETSLELAALPSLSPVSPPLESLRRRALSRRPEVAEAEAMIAAAEARIESAEREYRPDVTVGFSYTVVDRRQDAAGRRMPPEGNGDDVFGLTAGVNLPVWKAKLAAAVEEAVQGELAAREGRRAVITGIDRSLGDLAQRLPLTWDRLQLFEEVLAVQADESLRSAEAAYAAGTAGALDLLDAERVLLDVKIATARARADYAIALAQLEGAVGAPLTGELTEGDAS